jgi:hypothetical protein
VHGHRELTKEDGYPASLRHRVGDRAINSSAALRRPIASQVRSGGTDHVARAIEANEHVKLEGRPQRDLESVEVDAESVPIDSVRSIFDDDGDVRGPVRVKQVRGAVALETHVHRRGPRLPDQDEVAVGEAAAFEPSDPPDGCSSARGVPDVELASEARLHSVATAVTGRVPALRLDAPAVCEFERRGSVPKVAQTP